MVKKNGKSSAVVQHFSSCGTPRSLTMASHSPVHTQWGAAAMRDTAHPSRSKLGLSVLPRLQRRTRSERDLSYKPFDHSVRYHMSSKRLKEILDHKFPLTCFLSGLQQTLIMPLVVLYRLQNIKIKFNILKLL